MSHNWCPEIYHGMYVDRFNDDKIRVAPCCQAESEIESVEGFDFKTSKHLSALRQKFDQNEKPEACDRCWKMEKVGHKSRRLSAIEFYASSLPDHIVSLESLDHNATWACNLACVMCGPLQSSSWANELNYDKHRLASIGRRFQKNNNFLNNLDLSNIKKIHFNGGEPLLNSDQTSILKKLEQQGILKNTFISYNTNGTVMPDTQLIDLWKKARLVKLFFSIDAIGIAFEYVRWPAQWAQVNKNLLTMQAQLPSNVMFGFNVTVGSYNILEMIDVVDWFEQNLNSNREGDISDFNWQLANNFSPANLDITIKKLVIDQLKTRLKLQNMANYLESTLSDTANDNWIQQLNLIDQRRGTNWQNSLKIGKYYKEFVC